MIVRHRQSLVTIFMYIVTMTSNLSKAKRKMGRLMEGWRKEWNQALKGRAG